MKVSNGADTGGSNRVGVTMGRHSEDGVVGEVESKVDTGDSYRLDLLIPNKDHAENFPSCNLADILANSFSNLSLISMDFRSSPAFFVSFSHLVASNGTSGCKPLDSISPGGPATCTPSNILGFYH